MIENSITGFPPLFVSVAVMHVPVTLSMPIACPPAMAEAWMLMMLPSHVCDHGGKQGAAVHAPFRSEGAEVHVRVMTLCMCHHVTHPAKNTSTADVNAWDLHLCMGFHVAPQQRQICKSLIALRTLVWSLLGGMEMHVVPKHLLAATALIADGTPKLVTMDITEMGIVLTLRKEALAALFAVMMTFQDCPASPPGMPLKTLALACALRHIQRGICVRLISYIRK